MVVADNVYRRLIEIAARNAGAPPMGRRSPEHATSLSFAQESFWFTDAYNSANTALTMPYGLRLRGTLDQDALYRSLDELVRRHEILRAIFPARDTEPIQLVQPH